jgi:hypothetical protein
MISSLVYASRLPAWEQQYGGYYRKVFFTSTNAKLRWSWR